MLGTVVTAATHFSEEQAFVRLAERARPWWLGVAAVLQAGTYIAQGWIWRAIGTTAGSPLSRRAALELAFAKLFTDQALPSAGLSSSIVIAKALERRRLPASAVKASILVNIASYHLAYAVALTGALVLLQRHGATNAVVMVTAGLFLVFSLGLSIAILSLSGRSGGRPRGWIQKIPGLSTTVNVMSGADVRLVRSPRILAEALALQGAIVLLDAATLWVLILAVGTTASVGSVFASFMIASLFRTMGIVPGAPLAAEHIVGRVEDDTRADFGGGAGYVGRTGGIDRKGQCRVQLAIIDAVERRGVDDPVRRMLPDRAGDAHAVGDVDVAVTEPDGPVAKGLHQVLAKLARCTNDQHLHAVAPAARVSFSQRMLKKRGSLSGSGPKSPRSRPSQIVLTASPTPRSALKPMAFWILAPLT